MKIAFVSNRSWDLLNFRGGIYNRLLNDGCEIILIAPPGQNSPDLSGENIRYFPFSLNIYSMHPVKEIRTFLQLFRIYRKSRPDLVFHYAIKPNLYGTIAAALLRIPSVAVVTGLGLFADNRLWLFRKLSHLVYQLVVILSGEIWFLNTADRDYFVRKVRVPGRKIDIIPGEGIDTGRFSPSGGKGMEKETRFLFAGRLVWAKGLRELAAAVQKVQPIYPEARFQLLGCMEPSNPGRILPEQLEQWQKQGIFEYLGETHDVVPFLKKCDGVVLPSYREGMSRLLLEASAMGLPVIATDVTGCREIVEHGVTGWLCQPENSDDLADKLLQFLSMSREERHQMGLSGRKKTLEQFDEKIVFRHYLRVIRKYYPSFKTSGS